MSDPGEEIGTLVVVVLKARNLRDKHTFYKQDAYAQATLNKVTKKTQVDVKGGQHPVWDEELRFSVSKRVSDETRKLEVSCWSKEPRTDECVGKGTVDISNTLKTGEFDDWVPLQMEDGTYRGEIFLEMTYYAKTPPLQRRASKWKPTERLARPTTAYAYPDVPPLPNAESSSTRTDSTISAAVGKTGNGGTSHAAYRHSTIPSQPSATPTEQSHTLPAAAHRTPVHKHDALPPLPEEPSATPEVIPAILRPGGGARRASMSPPRTSPPASNGLLPPEHPLHTRAPVPPRDPSPPTQLPFESVPPYLRPGGGHTPIPEPHIPPPQTYVPPKQPHIPPPQTYVPPPQPYTPPAQPYIPPTQPYVTPAPPVTVPQPYAQATAHTHAYPQQPYPPVSQAYGPPPPLQPHGSPPRHYQPLAQAYVPPPVPPPAPSYPSYGYPPPPPARVAEDRDTDDLPDPYLQARYKSPLPLPNEPAGGRPSTSPHRHSQQPAPPPSHPSSSTTRTTSPPPPPKAPQTAPTAAPAQRPAPTQTQTQAHSRGPSREERDRLLALQLEKEEEERQRKLREQEERDNELARQLDLELNLEQENAARQGAGSAGSDHIPGAW